MPQPKTSAEVRALLQNRVATRPTNEVPTVAVVGSTATIRLYEPIDSYGGWWGLSADDLSDAVDSLPAEVAEIRLLINSPGGDVFDGVAIANILAAHPARVIAVVQGLAASAASFIAARSDELVMNPGAMLMIHDASAAMWGWAEDHRQIADLLDKISDNLAGIYVAKAGGSVAEWRARMLAETWYTADEAVAIGLADRVGDPSTEDAPVDAEPPTPDPAPFEDRAWLTVADAYELVGIEPPTAETDETAEPSQIDLLPEEDVDAPCADDINGRNALNAMRLALVNLQSTPPNTPSKGAAP